MPEWLGARCPGARDARVGRFNCFLFNANTLFCSATICQRVSAFKYHPCGLFVDGDMTGTYDLLVISELEVVLHHTILIPGGVRTVRKAGVGSKWKRRERTS